MTIDEFMDKLGTTQGVTRTAGADEQEIRTLTAPMDLPAAHRSLLSLTNGVGVFGNYFRLFGCCSTATIDMLGWNDSKTWKFAWDKPLDEFWFFGETAWGDQYAYQKGELRQSSTPRVFFLEALTMNEEIIASDFESFLEKEMLRNAIQPYDENLVAVRQRLGDLQPLEHIAYAPTLLVTGDENVGSVTKLDAVASMIIGGDLYKQLVQQPQDRPIKKLQPYEDSNGRSRMRVVWD